MKKILLINPPSPFLTYPNAAPHLGIGYLISYLRQHGASADYLNLEMVDPLSVELPEGYDYYGFTAVSAQYYFCLLLLRQIKERALGRSVIGGAHASVMAEQCLADGFDYIVKGYGEIALQNIVLGNAETGIIQGTFVERLDELPFPAWDELLESNYEISYGDNVAHMFSLRGCPYTCSYCSSAEIFGTRTAFRGIANVVSEIVYLKERFGVNKIYFLDPTFTVNRRRAIELAAALKDLDVHWTCETRVDLIDRQILRAFAQAGCDLISYGIETGAESVHDRLGKGTSVELNGRAINMSHDAGLRVKAFLMGALPEDDQRSVDAFQKFISAHKPDNWLFSTFIPFPGTDQWKDPGKFGITIECRDFRAYYNLGLNARGPVNISNAHLTRDALYELRNHMLNFLLTEVPNPRVDKALELFPGQRSRMLPFLDGLDERYMF